MDKLTAGHHTLLDKKKKNDEAKRSTKIGRSNVHA